jgi:predicted RNase H-like HicB family nuclease
MHKFSAVIYPDAGSNWLVAYNPETGTTTQGKTPAKALANLKVATRLCMEEFPLTINQPIILTTFEIKPVTCSPETGRS